MWWVANLSDFQWTLHPSCLHIATLIFILIPTLCNSCRMNSHSSTVRPGQSELIIWLFTGDGGSGEPSIQCLQTWQGGVKCQLWGQTAPSWWCRPQSGCSVLLRDPSYPDPLLPSSPKVLSGRVTREPTMIRMPDILLCASLRRSLAFGAYVTSGSFYLVVEISLE